MSDGHAGPVRGRERRRPDRYDPTAYTPSPIAVASSSDASKVAAANARLRGVSRDANFNAAPSLHLNNEGVCTVNTAKMHIRSKQEVWNYAYLTNTYLEAQRGGSAKIKSTKTLKDKQRLYCGAVRTENGELFEGLNKGKNSGDKMYSVVAHVPDTAISGKRADTANIGESGMFATPGWLPMTDQANGLVAQLASKTGQEVSEIRVDGARPDCLLPIADYANPHADMDVDASTVSSSAAAAAAASSSSMAMAVAAAAASSSPTPLPPSSYADDSDSE